MDTNEDPFRLQTVLHCSAHHLRFPLEEFVKYAAAKGWNRIELYAAAPHLFINHCSRSNAPGVRQLLEKYSVHPDVFTPRPYGYSLMSDPGTMLAEATLLYYAACIHAAKTVGAQVVCITPANGLLGENRKRLISNFCQALEILAFRAGEEDMTLALGASLPSEAVALNTLTELLEVLNRLACPTVKALLDTHVAFQAGESLSGWLSALGDRITHVHLSDGRSGGYRVWGEGCYPLDDVLATLRQGRYAGSLSLYLPGERYVADPYAADQKNEERLLDAAGTDAW